jgi:hypothetical protein
MRFNTCPTIITVLTAPIEDIRPLLIVISDPILAINYSVELPLGKSSSKKRLIFFKPMRSSGFGGFSAMG